MGVTYIPRNKKIEKLDVNFAGADLLGELHAGFGLPVTPRRFTDQPHRVPYMATAAQAREWSKHLEKRVTDQAIRDGYATLTRGGLWGEGVNEYVAWVRKWQTFLATCSGYRSD